MMIAGVDGCANGWLVVIETANRQCEVIIAESFARLLADQRLQLIVADIPIGLTSDGPRRCDREARQFIDPRRSSVFPAPLRAMLQAENWEEACRIRQTIDGKRCSKQAWAITAKIREVDDCMSAALQQRVFEGHPEVSFASMNGGHILQSKHTLAGKQLRIDLLSNHFPRVDELLYRHAHLKADGDIIDALACLWTVRRLANDSAKHFPMQPVCDERGLRCEIVA